jgi:uncharacterized membrane protein
VNLDTKIYWHDEVFTSLRTAGYKGEEVIEKIFTGEILGRSDLLQYQEISPENNFQDTLEALKSHPEHPPLYYILVRLWQDQLGSSVTTTRSLSIIFSLFSIPIFYFLCSALFSSNVVGSVGFLLITVSPFHVLYAQEAREYSLWILITLLSYWSFWEAVQNKKKSYWWTYAITTILNFYTSLLSLLVIVSQGIYLLLREKHFYTPAIRRYLLVMLGSAIAFSPWLNLIITNYEQLKAKTAWTEAQPDYSFLVKIWGLHFSSLFLDLGVDISHPYSYLIPPLILLLIGYGFVVLIPDTNRSIWLFLLCSFLIPTLLLISPDLIFGGQRSISTRYFVPSLIAAQILVAYLFAVQIRNRKRLWQGLFIILLMCGLFSCWKISQANVWWNKGVSFQNAQVAEVINQTETPLVISDNRETNLGNVISLAYLVKPSTQFKLVTQSEQLNGLEQFDSIFLFHLSPELETALLKQYQAQVVEISQKELPLTQISINQ